MHEQEVLALLRAGDERGAEALLRHYAPLMRYIIAPIVPDAQDGGSEELSGDLPSAEPTPEERLLQQERRQALERALTALPQRDRLLFYRKYYYRQSTAQIAAELGTTERAVEGRLYRIKKALRKALGGDDA